MGSKRETGSAALGMGGTMLPEQGGWVRYHVACNAECGCPTAQDGKVPRCQEREVPRCPERDSCRSHPGKQFGNVIDRLLYCQACFLPSLSYCQVYLPDC